MTPTIRFEFSQNLLINFYLDPCYHWKVTIKLRCAKTTLRLAPLGYFSRPGPDLCISSKSQVLDATVMTWDYIMIDNYLDNKYPTFLYMQIYIWVEKVWRFCYRNQCKSACMWLQLTHEFLGNFSFWKPIFPHLSVCKAQLTLALEKVGPWDIQDPIRTYCERIPQFVDRHKLVFAIGNLLWDKT